jgi:hypothetical protein
MNPAYADLWAALKMGASLEKWASAEDREVATRSQVENAKLCDSVIERALKVASEQFPQRTLLGKEAGVAAMTQLVLSLRDTHAATGEKLAAAPEAVADGLIKLATAVFTDLVISEQLTKLSGDEAQKARMTQLLGREYMVEAIRSLLA